MAGAEGSSTDGATTDEDALRQMDLFSGSDDDPERGTAAVLGASAEPPSDRT